MCADNKQYPGVLIAFEGLDGSGKSTQIEMAAGKLREQGVAVLTTREPTDGPYGKQIRQLYIDRQSVTLEEELALFVADRKEHVATCIGPALEEGKVVLTDRYYYSTAAYQGAAGLDPEAIVKENESFAPRPAMVIFIELPVAESLHRITTLRGETPNAFEQENELRKVQEVFDSVQESNFKRVDGRKTVEEVHTSIMVHLQALLVAKDVIVGGCTPS